MELIIKHTLGNEYRRFGKTLYYKLFSSMLIDFDCAKYVSGGKTIFTVHINL